MAGSSLSLLGGTVRVSACRTACCNGQLTLLPGYPDGVDTVAPSLLLQRETQALRVIAAFTVKGEPMSKARARFTRQGSKTQAYTPEKTHEAEDIIGWNFRRAAPRHKLDSDGAYGVAAAFFSGTRQRRDVDNMLKLILDGLNGVAWPDDSQVIEVSSRKALTTPDDAHTEIAVYEVGSVQRLTDQCAQCGREYPTFQCLIGERRYCSKACFDAARRTWGNDATCKGCGRTFVTRKQSRVFCSAECRLASGRVTLTCDGCGTLFTKQACHVRHTANYCSDKCRDDAHCGPKRAYGICDTCGGPTSKAIYRQCLRCRHSGAGVQGKPGQAYGPASAC